jgi:hypothetical protein
MSWKPYPKISQVFLGLGNLECKLHVFKNWGSHVLKIMSKKFPGLGLGNPHRVRPKTEISRLENHVLKNSISRFWWTPPMQANSRWPKIEIVKNSTGKGQWLEESSRHCPHRQTDTVALIMVISTTQMMGTIEDVMRAHNVHVYQGTWYEKGI